MTKENTTKKLPKGCGIAFYSVAALLSIVFVVKTCDFSEDPPLTVAEQRIADITKCFSVWDGSHDKLTEAIKKSMNDPNSYEHISTQHWDRDTVILVKTIYTGKNALGGIVKRNMSALMDNNCNVLEITEHY